jgi:hypothetical protein
MPDDDRFPRYLTPAWRKVLRSIQGRDPVERVTDCAARALAATVRAVNGVPSLLDLAERMREAAILGDSLQQLSAAGSCHVPTKIAEQAAAALAATMQRELALVSPVEAAMLLARRVLSDFAQHYGFDRMVHQLLGESLTMAELGTITSEVLAGDQVSVLAGRFLSRPTGQGLRAPSRRRSRLSSSELLHTNLGDL